jgi:copper chaperone CopZ
MKLKNNILKLILVALSSITLMNITFAETTPIIEKQSQKEVKMLVNGMTCSACVANLQKVFQENKDIENIDVNLETKEVNVKLRNQVSDDVLKSLVEKAGYSVEKITSASTP